MTSNINNKFDQNETLAQLRKI